MLNGSHVPQSIALAKRRFSGLKKGVEDMPSHTIIFAPDTSIIAASDIFLSDTYTSRKNIKDRSFFEVFPHDPENLHAVNVERIQAFFKKVVEEKRMGLMPVHRYDIPRLKSNGGGFEERYWKNVTYPIFDRKDNMLYLVMTSENVTKQVVQSKLAAVV